MELLLLAFLAGLIYLGLMSSSSANRDEDQTHGTPHTQTASSRPGERIPVLEAKISMKFSPLCGTGRAAIEWFAADFDDVELRPLLAALLYARILVAHEETRTALFWLIDEYAKRNVRDQGATGFSFPAWTVDLPDGVPDQHIWPWEVCHDPTSLDNPSQYDAILVEVNDENGHWFALHLDMARGQERALAPAAPLLLIQDLALSGGQEGCYTLALLLWQVNEYYGTPEHVQIHSEPKALASAMEALQSGGLQVP